MTAEEEKVAFLQAIKDDPYDATTRRVYADWLEDHGFDDEARVQREWTPEKHKEAEAFVARWAKLLSGREYEEDDELVDEWIAEEGHRQYTPEEVLAVAARHLGKSLDGYAGADRDWIGLRFDTPDEITSARQRKLFWRHFQTLTGTPVEDGFDSRFVSCGC